MAQEVRDSSPKALQLEIPVFPQGYQKISGNLFAINGLCELRFKCRGLGFAVIEQVFFELIQNNEYLAIRSGAHTDQQLIQRLPKVDDSPGTSCRFGAGRFKLIQKSRTTPAAEVNH